jgi:hypothetical protein
MMADQSGLKRSRDVDGAQDAALGLGRPQFSTVLKSFAGDENRW